MSKLTSQQRNIPIFTEIQKSEDTDDSKELLINLNVIQVFISIKVAMQTAFFCPGLAVKFPVFKRLISA